MPWTFKCINCGDCCKNLRPNKIKGLLIQPHEVDLFSREQVELCLGKGKSPNHSTFVIWAFQLIDDTCPHLKENRCTIYANRPIFCRAYPFRMRSRLHTGKFLMSIAPECRALMKAKDSGEFQEDMDMLEITESIIAKQIGYWMMDFQKRKKKVDTPWVYNLVTNEWEVYKIKRRS